MKKQNTLDWLVRNLESWPNTRTFAPNVNGFRWFMTNGSLFLFDDDHMGNIEDLTIYKAEWEQALEINKNTSSKTDNKKVYIAGPMTGYDNFNRSEFNNAANYLSMHGYVVLNPAILPSGLSEAEYMKIDLAMLQCCDTIFMLNGWEQSMGANAERSLAIKLGMNILDQEK
jgi:hypothetical protein